MGRARKTNQQKNDAKQANHRNMKFMQQQAAMLVSETKPKKKRGTNIIPQPEPSQIEPDVPDIEPDVPEDLTVKIVSLQQQQAAMLVSETKPKKKRGTSITPQPEPSQIEPDVPDIEPDVPEDLTVKIVSLQQQQAGMLVSETKPKNKCGTSTTPAPGPSQIGPDVPKNLTVNPKAVPALAVFANVPEDFRLDSTANPVQPDFAGCNVSVIKVVLDCDENASEVVNEEIVMDAPDVIKELENQVATLSLEIESIKRENARLCSLNKVGENQIAALSSEVQSLKRENARLHSLNMRLQEALIERPNGIAFTEVPGFPDARWLLSVSQNAQDSDYLFVKELVFSLFPLGVGNATVSGHPSNNPLGRGSRNGLELDARTNVERLDPEKVKYIRDRLHERRIILQDELGVAVQRSRKTARHIAAVINNNPSLRTLRQQ